VQKPRKGKPSEELELTPLHGQRWNAGSRLRGTTRMAPRRRGKKERRGERQDARSALRGKVKVMFLKLLVRPKRQRTLQWTHLRQRMHPRPRSLSITNRSIMNRNIMMKTTREKSDDVAAEKKKRPEKPETLASTATAWTIVLHPGQSLRKGRSQSTTMCGFLAALLVTKWQKRKPLGANDDKEERRPESILVMMMTRRDASVERREEKEEDVAKNMTTPRTARPVEKLGGKIGTGMMEVLRMAKALIEEKLVGGRNYLVKVMIG